MSLLGRVGVHLIHSPTQRREHTKTTTRKKRKKQPQRENLRERTRERESETPTKNTFIKGQREKHRKDSSLSLSHHSHHGEPRSGGNLERVTREERERGAFTRLLLLFSLFSFSFTLSLKEVRRAKSVFGDSVPFHMTPHLRRVFVDPNRNVL